MLGGGRGEFVLGGLGRCDSKLIIMGGVESMGFVLTRITGQ